MQQRLEPLNRSHNPNNRPASRANAEQVVELLLERQTSSHIPPTRVSRNRKLARQQLKPLKALSRNSVNQGTLASIDFVHPRSRRANLAPHNLRQRFHRTVLHDHLCSRYHPLLPARRKHVQLSLPHHPQQRDQVGQLERTSATKQRPLVGLRRHFRTPLRDGRLCLHTGKA